MAVSSAGNKETAGHPILLQQQQSRGPKQLLQARIHIVAVPGSLVPAT